VARKEAPGAQQTVHSPELANLIEGYREEIVALWVRFLYSMQGSHYGEPSVTELQATARAGIAALATLFRTGSYTELNRYSRDVSHRRAEQGFDIAEIIEGHLCLYEAVVPIIQRECRWDVDDDAALRMGASLDAALRWLVVRFSRLYALALNVRLQAQVQLLEEQRRQLESRVKEVSALMRSAALITSTLDLNRVLDLILEQLATVVDYDRASVLMLFDGMLRIIAGRGFLHPEDVLGLRFDPGQNMLTRRLIEGREPVILEDVTEDSGYVTDPGDPTRSWVGVPLIVRDEVIGALALDKKEPSFYDQAAGEKIMAFANQAAIAVENAQLYDRAREQDILKERNRLARELHDSLSQALFSMVLNAEAALLFFDSDQDKAKNQISLLHETANAALKEMRTLIFELRPANLEQEGLAAVLKKHARLVAERYGFKVEVSVHGQGRLPLPIEKALYRVAQEALNNIIKHAHATYAKVILSTQENIISLAVEDNGVGLGTGGAKPNTLGLTSMRERVEQLGGTFEIGPNPSGQGTRVKVTVPCDE
jgi:signal transduction histidine kinase